MKLFYVVKVQRSPQLKVTLQRHSLIEGEVKRKHKVLRCIHIHFKIPLTYRSMHHVKVTSIRSLQTTLFPFLFKFLKVEILNPKVETICHLYLTPTLALHRLEVYYVFSLIVND